MLRKMSLGTKLLLAFLVVGVVPFSVMGFLSLYYSSRSLSEQAFSQLDSIRQIKASAVKRYFRLIDNQIITFSQNRMVVRAMAGFDRLFPMVKEQNKVDDAKMQSMRAGLSAYYKDQFGVEYQKQNHGNDPRAEALLAKLDADSLVLQSLYISRNKHPLGSKDELAAPADGSEYSKLHAQIHPVVRNYLKKFGYYDIFLVEPKNGDIVYSVFKELDYTTSLLNGPYADTNFGRCFKAALDAGRQGKADAVVLVDYQRYFPSYEAPAGFIASPIMDGGKLLGVAMFQMPIDQLNEIMGERAGMGKTGETYLVGPDKLMRSDSYLDPKHHTVKSSFADPSKGAVDTEAVRDALTGKTGEKIISDYNGNPVLSSFMPLKVGEFTWALVVEIDESEAFAPVTTIKYMMAIVALAGIVGIVLVGLVIGRSIGKPINSVVTGLNEGADQVAAAAGQVSSSSQTLAEGASEQAASLEETASSIEEMSSMTRQNAQNAGQADSLMKEAQQVVAETSRYMDELKASIEKIDSASGEMAKIIKSIDEIAFQTNLLALNAAVEAARAGEAGAGFAVVADEVRNLAMRAAEAAGSTGELIEGNIGNIKLGTELVGTTGEAFSRVAEAAAKAAELVAEIAVASDEQAQGIEQINKAAGEMDKVTQHVAANAEESAAAAEELSAQAETMKGMVVDLAVMVEGARAAGHHKPNSGQKRPPARKALPPAGKTIAQKKASVHKPSSQAVEAIPLGDDDFADF